MIVTKKALPRRTFLKGVGTTLALPLLDAMIPPMTALAGTAAAPARLRRLGFDYIPMGCDITRWTPPGASGLDELSEILSPLAPVKPHVSVITNLELRNAYPGTHATSNAAFLSAARAKLTESSDYYLGTTVDQIAAKQIGAETQLPSLEMSMDLLSTVGQCDNGYACVYQNNLSWSSPTTPLPAEAHPRIVFERLFGEGGSAADRRAALAKRASLLDSVTEEIARLQNQLGPADRARVGQYSSNKAAYDRWSIKRSPSARSSAKACRSPSVSSPRRLFSRNCSSRRCLVGAGRLRRILSNSSSPRSSIASSSARCSAGTLSSDGVAARTMFTCAVSRGCSCRAPFVS